MVAPTGWWEPSPCCPAAIGVPNSECGVRNEILRYAQNDRLFVLQEIFFIYKEESRNKSQKSGILRCGLTFLRNNQGGSTLRSHLDLLVKHF